MEPGSAQEPAHSLSSLVANQQPFLFPPVSVNRQAIFLDCLFVRFVWVELDITWSLFLASFPWHNVFKVCPFSILYFFPLLSNNLHLCTCAIVYLFTHQLMDARVLPLLSHHGKCCCDLSQFHFSKFAGTLSVLLTPTDILA